MSTTIKIISCTFAFFLLFIISANCSAWQSGEGTGFGAEGYETESPGGSGWIDPAVAGEPNLALVSPRCRTGQNCYNLPQTWFKLYILNPIRGMYRTNFD